MQKIYRRTPMPKCDFCNFIEIALRHGCSPVNLPHLFRTPFPRNTSGRLLLSIALVNSLRSLSLLISFSLFCRASRNNYFTSFSTFCIQLTGILTQSPDFKLSSNTSPGDVGGTDAVITFFAWVFRIIGIR